MKKQKPPDNRQIVRREESVHKLCCSIVYIYEPIIHNIMKKKTNQSFSDDKGSEKHGISRYLALSLCMLTFIGASAQTGKVTLKIENAPVKELFNAIEKQSSYRFSYRDADLKGKQNVTVSSQDENLKDVLTRELAKQGLSYRVQDNLIIILPVSQQKSTTSKTNKITGIVKDTNGEPIIGANITVKGQSIGTITDIDGQFTLDAPEDAVLQISYIGYVAQDIHTKGKKEFNVMLEEDSEMLDEVVVVGYGSMRKRDLTGAVSSINSKKFEKDAPRSVEDLLRTGVPGLNIGLSNTAKGDVDLNSSVQIRGQRSLKAGNGPLVVLDGIIFLGELSEINPSDIDRIDVLKDAASAAIYGAKSANGVILITTQKGQTGKPVIRFDASIGFATMGANREVYDPEGYLQYRSDYFNSSNNFQTPAKFVRPTTENLKKYGMSIEEWRAMDNLQGSDEDIWLQRIGLTDTERENYFAGKTNDWYDTSFRTSIRQDYNASLSGSSENFSYYWSLGYMNSTGVIEGNEYESLRSNLKLDAKVTDFLEMGLNINFQNRSDGDFTVSWREQIIRNTPYALAYDETGSPIRHPMGESGMNPGWNDAFDRQYKSLDKGSTVFNGTIYAKIKLPFNISYQMNFSPRSRWYHDRYHESSQNPNYTHNGEVIREQTQYFSWQLDNYTFADKHTVNVTLLQNAEKQLSWQDRMTGLNLLPTDALGFHYINGADMTRSKMKTNDEQVTADALMARVFYSYSNRYMITASIRRDGYSAFGKSNPRATFPAVALAWNFADEEFFKWKPMNYGKLRLSWGKNGNRDIGKYEALANMTTGQGKYPYITSSGSILELSQLYADRMANHGLKWETTTSWNVGLDFGFFNNRINGSMEYYYMPTTDLIMSQSLPSVSGYTNVTTNLGEVVNKGFELSVNTLNISRKNFDWSSTFSFSLNRNEIKHLYYEYEDVLDADGHVVGSKEKDDITNNWFIGQPVGVIWDYNVIGVYQENEREEAAKYGLVPGDAKIKDNYDVESHRYTNEDKEFLGQTTPKFRWTFRNDFTLFKDLSLSVSIYSYWGHKGTTTDYMNNSKVNGWSADRTNAYVTEYWTPENPSNTYCRLNSTNPQNVTPPLVLDKSFIRLDNISLSWNVPQKFLKPLTISSLRVYGSIRNVACWTKEWDYWDPEISDGPSPRTFTLGVSLTL